MAKTVIGFEIDIEGIDDINKLNAEIKETNQALKKAKIGTEEYSQTAEKLAKLKAEQKALRKQQTDLTKSFLEQTKALSTYDKASAKLNRLRKEFKNLAFEGKESTREGKALREEINKLDKQLKGTDAKVGQFQRSVGNYPRIFGLSTKSLGQFIPGLDKLSERLDKATGGTNVLGKALIGGFVAFKAGKFLVDVFKQFDELIKKIDETRNAVKSLTGLGGEDLDNLTASVTALSSTFEVDAEQINKSAAALSEELGISFESALTKIEAGLLAGQVSNEEFLSSIESTPEAFKEVSAAATDYSKRQKELLGANKELAAAQIELTNEFAGSASEVRIFANKALANLIKVGLSLVDALKPVVRSFFDIGKALGELIGSLFGAGDAAKGLNNVFQGLGKVLKFSADVSLFFINSLRAGVDFLRGDASTAFKLFTKEGRILAQAEEQLAETTKELTNEFQNETKELNSLFGQLANTNKNTDERRELIKKLNDQYGDYLPNIDLEKAGQEAIAAAYEATTKAIAQNFIDRKKLELQSKAQNEVLEGNIDLEKARQNLLTNAEAVKASEDRIKKLKEEGAGYVKIAFEVKRGAQAFRQFEAAQKEFNKVQREVNKTTAANKKEIELLEKASGRLVNTLSEFVKVDDLAAKAAEEAAARTAAEEKKAAEERKKREEKAAKEAIERQKKLLEQLRKDRETFLKGEAAFIQKQSALLGKLQEQQEKLFLKGITDAQEKARIIAQKASEDRIKAAESDFNKLKELLSKREEEAARLFGGDSEKLKELQAQNKKLIESGAEEVAGIRTREAISLTNELLKIDQDFRDKRTAAQQKELQEDIKAAKTAEELKKIALERSLNEGLITEEEFNNKSLELRRETVSKELELIKAREDALKAAGEDATEAEKTEADAILLQKENLYLELSKLDKAFNDQQKAQLIETTKKTEEENKKRLEDFKETFSQVTEGFNIGLELISGLQEAADQRRAEAIAKEEEQNKAQNENLQERLSQASGLEAQFLEQQIAANEGAAAAIAAKREEIEKRQAKRAKARAIIESIIQTALAVVEALPDPIRATFAGVAGAAATATIAAQPLAKGGKVGTLSGEVVQFAGGGKVTNKGNIKPLSNGDNVLATLKTGEAVLNQGQISRLGGPSVLRAVGVPGFAEGGLVGAPVSLVQKSDNLSNENRELLSKLESGIEATNSRIDRLQIIWTAETQSQQDKGLEDRDNIQANAKF